MSDTPYGVSTPTGTIDYTNNGQHTPVNWDAGYTKDSGDSMNQYVANNQDLFAHISDPDIQSIINMTDDGVYSVGKGRVGTVGEGDYSDRTGRMTPQDEANNTAKDLQEGSLGETIAKQFKDFWGGLGDQGKATVLGMGMKAIGAMADSSGRKLSNARTKSEEAQAAMLTEQAAKLKRQQQNQAGIGLINFNNQQPVAYQQATINRPKVGG